MKMIEITKDRFEEFVGTSNYKNYCQTSNYGIFMTELGFDYSFIAYADNDENILAAGMFLTKKMGKTYLYAYCPKGYIINYNDKDLIQKFTKNLIKYYKRKNIILLKINPEIPIYTIDYNNNYEKTETASFDILNFLKSLGFKRRKELEPLELLEPKISAIVDTEKYNLDKLDEKTKTIITGTLNGLELLEVNATKMDTIYSFIKNDNHLINYYRNFYNSFKKDDLSEMFLIKVNYENFLIDAKKNVERETEINDALNEKLKINVSEEAINQKMESDKMLEKYKNDVIYLTKGLKKKEKTYVGAAIVIKYDNKATIVASGIDENYEYMDPYYFMYHSIIEKYKGTYKYVDLYEIADDFSENSPYKKLNDIKIAFKPKLNENVGEFDLVISEWKFKIAEKNNLLSSEFNKKKHN